jgi:hypothetical protein
MEHVATAGTCYKCNKNVRTLLKRERVNYDKNSGKDDESRLMLQMEVNY